MLKEKVFMLQVLRVIATLISVLGFGVLLSILLKNIYKREQNKIKSYQKAVFLYAVHSIIMTVPLYSGCFGSKTIEIFVNSGIFCLIVAVFIIPNICRYYMCTADGTRDDATRRLKVGFQFVLEFIIVQIFVLSIIYA